MIICQHCGRENEDHYKFCLGCGSQLPKPEPPEPVAPAQPQMINCPHCGTIVPDNFKFCGACGGPIAAATSAPVAPAPIVAPPSENTAPISQMSAASLDVDDAGLQSASAATVHEPFNPNMIAHQPTSTSHQTLAAEESAPQVGSAMAKLVVIRPDGTEGATINLNSGELVIGRDSEHDVLANDPFLSPEHARLSYQDDTFLIQDLNSLNGIFYRIRGESELQSGDLIRLGQELLEFKRIQDVAAQSHKQEDDTLRGGSPDTGYWGTLSLISGPELSTRAFAFSEDEIQIGREIGDIVFRDDGFVSGRHARITKVDDRVLLKDLGSSNGTYIRIKSERQLHNDDLILMGQQLFRLVM